MKAVSRGSESHGYHKFFSRRDCVWQSSLTLSSLSGAEVSDISCRRWQRADPLLYREACTRLSNGQRKNKAGQQNKREQNLKKHLTAPQLLPFIISDSKIKIPFVHTERSLCFNTLSY
jgi:hypothetical protein